MAEVFISYKREDRELAAALDQFLRAQGFSAWWDTSLIAGEKWNSAIGAALDKAKCVVVLWTENSYASMFVQAEAMEGFQREILVAARLDDVKLKIPYTIIQTADLRGWKGEQDHPGLQEILDGVRLKLAQPAEAPPHYPRIVAGAPIAGRATRPGDQSIWDDPGREFNFQEASPIQSAQTVRIQDGPRAYARFIPAGWKDGPLSVADFVQLAQQNAIGSPSNACDSGSFGGSYFGAVQFWLSSRAYDHSKGYQPPNACLYFDDTGEFWIVHGTAIVVDDSAGFILPDQTVAAWSKSLRQTMKIFDEYGASPERRVEFGIVGLTNVVWSSGPHMRLSQPRSRKPAITLERQLVGWSADQQVAMLRHAYNELRGAFSMPKLEEKQFLADLHAYDTQRFQQS